MAPENKQKTVCTMSVGIRKLHSARRGKECIAKVTAGFTQDQPGGSGFGVCFFVCCVKARRITVAVDVAVVLAC